MNVCVQCLRHEVRLALRIAVEVRIHHTWSAHMHTSVHVCVCIPTQAYGACDMQVTDLITDAYVLKEVTNHGQSNISDLVAPWICCFALASIVSLASMSLKLKAFFVLLRQQRDEFDIANQTEGSKKLQKHQKRFSKAARKISMIYASVLVGAIENFPMGCLQIIYAQRLNERMGTVALISLVLSCISLGDKVGNLHRLYELYQVIIFRLALNFKNWF